ncbi:MAG: hypothetical protein JWN43_4974, partial [Gammaproteobacteria bacterium]|nr:hypothetical protein [Gammaproteobacteria bacterium]
SKTTTCTRLIFDTCGHEPYHTPPMAIGLPDLVDCARLSEDAAVLQRVYELADLPRVQDMLAEPRGTLSANFAFAKAPSGRPGAEVTVTATPQLVCQRCMQGYGSRVSGGSDVEFVASDEPETADSEREFFRMENGQVSLRDLAEEELLLAVPRAFMCSTPLTCGKAPAYVTGDEGSDSTGEMRRPFSALQDLLKKT